MLCLLALLPVAANSLAQMPGRDEAKLNNSGARKQDDAEHAPALLVDGGKMAGSATLEAGFSADVSRIIVS